jgi:hypothetical protein
MKKIKWFHEFLVAKFGIKKIKLPNHLLEVAKNIEGFLTFLLS